MRGCRAENPRGSRGVPGPLPLAEDGDVGFLVVFPMDGQRGVFDNCQAHAAWGASTGLVRRSPQEQDACPASRCSDGAAQSPVPGCGGGGAALSPVPGPCRRGCGGAAREQAPAPGPGAKKGPRCPRPAGWALENPATRAQVEGGARCQRGVCPASRAPRGVEQPAAWVKGGCVRVGELGALMGLRASLSSPSLHPRPAPPSSIRPAGDAPRVKSGIWT